MKNQKYEPNRGTGANSIALGTSSEASGVSSIALGTNAEASNDYQITIGAKFVYLRFASTDTEATVYAALSPWVNPTNGSSQGAMGIFGDDEITRVGRPDTNAIEINSKKIRSGNTTQIGENLAICTVMY